MVREEGRGGSTAGSLQTAQECRRPTVRNPASRGARQAQPSSDSWTYRQREPTKRREAAERDDGKADSHMDRLGGGRGYCLARRVADGRFQRLPFHLRCCRQANKRVSSPASQDAWVETAVTGQMRPAAEAPRREGQRVDVETVAMGYPWRSDAPLCFVDSASPG